MPLIRPRLTEHFGLNLSQASVPFAIPFLNEDLPLHVDPFLLWKSPSLQDQSLHGALITAFNRLGWEAKSGNIDIAKQTLVRLSECDEVGLGLSATRRGKRIGAEQASEIASLFTRFERYARHGFTHIEEMQFFVDGISTDRISDFACSLLKSFLIDFTIEESERVGLPLQDTSVLEVYDHRSHKILEKLHTKLPLNPINGRPLILVPKRWLRHGPWINFDDFFRSYIPKDERYNKVEWDRVSLLSFNRDNYDVVEEYVKLRERSSDDCKNDPLFRQIPLISAKRKLAEIKRLPSGKDQNADKKYEDAVISLLASMFYPNLDFAQDQVRTDGGTQIRDAIFYLNRQLDFLSDIYHDFGTRQLVFEMKNVRAVEREHVNQINRYLSGEFGRFGVLVTRNRLPRNIRRNTIDLWSGQRRCIIPLDDADLELMVGIFEDKRRAPIDVLKRSYLAFRRECPV